MKVSNIYSVVLAAGSAIAVPGKRAGQAITISDLKASQVDQQGYITFALKDPNYDDSTGANVIWYIYVPSGPIRDLTDIIGIVLETPFPALALATVPTMSISQEV